MTHVELHIELKSLDVFDMFGNSETNYANQGLSRDEDERHGV